MCIAICSLNEGATMTINKRLFLLLLGVATLIGSLAFGSTYWYRTAGPVLLARSLSQLGTYDAGQHVQIPFKVQNGGRKALVLNEFRKSCGCLTLQRKSADATEAVEQLILQPGEEVELVSGLIIRGHVGEHLREVIQFRTNDPSRREVQFAFEAVVGGRIIAVPSEINLGCLQLREKRKLSFELRDTQEREPLTVSSVRCNPERLGHVIRVRHLDRDDPGSDTINIGVPAYSVDVEIVAPEAPGELTGALEVLEHGSDQPVVTIPIRGAVVGKYLVSPSSLVLPRITAKGTALDTKCFVKSTSGQPFDLAVIDAPADVRVLIKKGPPASSFVITVGIARAPRTTMSRNVRLAAKSGQEVETVVLPVSLWSGE